MRYLAIILLLSSCSAQYHLNKAIKKGYKCEETGDTIRITTLDSIPVIIHDSIVWEKFITTKDTIIKYKSVYVPKTKIELKREYKLKIKTIYKDRIVEKLSTRVSVIKLNNQYKDIGDMPDEELKNLEFQFDKSISLMLN